MRFSVLILGAFLLVGGCRMGPEGNIAAARADAPPRPLASAAASTTVKAPVAAPTAPAPQTAAPAAARPAGPHMDLPDTIAWQTWDAGLAQAKASKKPMMLLVWAHWCPHCRELTPVFRDPEVAALAKSLVMVQQNADESPAWLNEKFDSLYGGYVPRIFFLNADGSVRTDITSGNPQYPYFYVPQRIDALRTSLKRAAGV